MKKGHPTYLPSLSGYGRTSNRKRRAVRLGFYAEADSRRMAQWSFQHSVLMIIRLCLSSNGGNKWREGDIHTLEALLRGNTIYNRSMDNNAMRGQ